MSHSKGAHFSPGPNDGTQRKHKPLRPASAIKAEIEKMVSDFRRNNPDK